MSIFNTMADKIRDGIRTWLRVQPAQRGIINIQEIFDFEGNAIKLSLIHISEPTRH